MQDEIYNRNRSKQIVWLQPNYCLLVRNFDWLFREWGTKSLWFVAWGTRHTDSNTHSIFSYLILYTKQWLGPTWSWSYGSWIVQSVPITTKVVSSNPVHGEMYSIQHYVIKFFSDLRQVGGFTGTPVSSTNKTDRHLITDILLKVALNAINQTKPKQL